MNEQSLNEILFRRRTGNAEDEDEAIPANAFACLSAMSISDCGGPINVPDYFEGLFGDDVFNIKIDCDGGECIQDVIFWLQSHGYISRGRFPIITKNGRSFLEKALELTLEDSARSGDYQQIVYDVSASLMQIFGKLNLKPVAIPSFPLIGAGVFYMRRAETGVLHRFVIPDVLVRLDGYYIPPELGLSRYIAVEIQRSNFDRLKTKQEKYLVYNGAEKDVSRKAQLYPLYILQTNKIRSEDDARKLIEKVRRQISKALQFLPERDDRLFFNVAYFHRSGRLDWLFPPAKEVKVRGA